MASLSLPRVLQLKKNSLDAEREQFEKFQTLAIQKAINAIETPVKEKHVRSTIIGTFQEQSAITYWMVAIRLPLQDNRIVAWKFCHVTHKLLREGHPACLDDSQRHIQMIENLGKLWVHLREGYGRLVHLYTNLLVCKLKFHARNPRFPGNLQLTAEELDAIAENDVNNYFQLCVELFDYMDDILSLQEAVFDSLGNARANSMTASGQCRLAALIPCAQDSSQIYDCNVRLLFRLHAALPADTLTGHRERFRQQFRKLSSFYKHASSLQYYRNLLNLPVLPSNPPNFLLQSEFGTYVAPVVSIPEPPPDEVDAVGSLVDTSDSQRQMQTEPPVYTPPEPVPAPRNQPSDHVFFTTEAEATTASTPDHLDAFDTRTTPSPQPDPIVERDRLIDHLQHELKRMRSEASAMVSERNTMLNSMREHCTRLETQLQAAKTDLDEEKQKADTLIAQTPEIKQKLAETEEKAKITDEKFQKLKGAYTQLREEHITLIRQKAEVDKLSASLRAAAAQHESAKTALQQQLNDRMKDVELLQQSASSSEEIDAYKSEIANLRSELEQSRQKELELETLRASMEALEIENKTARVEQEEKMTSLANELKETTETLNRITQEKEDRESELSKVKEELVGLREKSSDQYTIVVEEKEAALKQVEELTRLHQQEKEVLDSVNKEREETIEQIRNEYESMVNEKEVAMHNVCASLETLKSEYAQFKEEKESEMNSLCEKLQEQGNRLSLEISERDANITQARDEIEKLKTELTELQNDKVKLDEEMSEAILQKEKERQDLLQHNTILEADVAALRRQLEDAKVQLEKQSTKIVECAGAAALEVTSDALAALEAGTTQEANAAAARRAADALSDLAKHLQVKGNEESLARSVIFAAHNTAQLSAYITEVSNVSTDIELSEKLNTECKTMLTATQQCLESLKNGTLESKSYADARSRVLTASQAAAAADRVSGGTSVDDELAGMDRAIEEAASQIEEMLAASRAGDSGVKLEVNGKILDACTTLMGAVKVLVQDSRALQNELGDPHTRQKMYRKNPQWSEGLISAAKAVVFAAKLLVTSADEAVGAATRLEGVSAAAHEVAGSTAQLVAASRARAPPASAPLARLTRASRSVAAATGALVAAVRAAAALRHDQEALDTTALTLTATRRLEMESKVRSLELESALEAERARLAALRKRHYQLAQQEENGNMTNGKE